VTTASTGAFTTLAASGAVTLSGGTANGVAYLNGSKVVTSGSALTFDGANIIVNATTPAYFTGTSNLAQVSINRSPSTGAIFNASQSAAYLNIDGASGGSSFQFVVASAANTQPSEQMRLTSTGLGIGTSSPDARLTVYGNAPAFTMQTSRSFTVNRNWQIGVDQFAEGQWTLTPSTTLGGSTYTTPSLIVNPSGNLGLGVTPSAWSFGKAIEVGRIGSAIWGVDVNETYCLSNAYYASGFKYGATGTATQYLQYQGQHRWYNAPSGTAGNAITFTQAMTLDASGNLGVGTTSPSQKLHVENSANSTTWTKVSNGSNGSGAAAGILIGTDQGDAGALSQNSSGNTSPAANALRLRNLLSAPITFETGGTERARIDSSGNLLFAKTTTSVPDVGILMLTNGRLLVTSLDQDCLVLNRQSTDGILAEFRHANTTEGDISISGTTVSYNGGHLSRYAQTTTAKDESLLKGTVLSNLDEMNVYTKDGQPVANEQLNKVKMSDVEGDANVAGVFVNWTHDDAHNVDEINMAMTGDMIIRIAQGTTVVRGDLLMSAGDGTAKPQGDDIVRSKTIAKVTSTHVTCTYADGSYCVPCVLMAC
jgi:hypothetical protein